MVGVTAPDGLTFAICAAICVLGSLGVVLSRNPVHAALMLILTLFGVAVLFLEQHAYFLAAVQVIVYAGAIVVLFLFVIMLLGVDREESIRAEPMPAQRIIALVCGLLALAEVIILARGRWPLGAHSVAGRARVKGEANTYVLGKSVFTTYLLPFEITSALLVVAIIGAVVLARRSRVDESDSAGDSSPGPLVEPPDLKQRAPASVAAAAADDTAPENERSRP
jgi:NADH-quinone oxidoreductase subunit J